MTTDLIGPVFTGAFEIIQAGEGNEMYRILYLPDKNNDQRRREGLAQAYYWMPDKVRIARKGDTGDYKFHLLHFEGVRSGETHVGVDGNQEVTGGVLALTTTMSPPLSVLQQAHQQLITKLRADDRPYWALGQPEPHIGPIPIAVSTAALSNLAPNQDGTLPSDSGMTGGGAPGAPGAPRSRFAPQLPALPRTITPRETTSRSNLDMWFAQLNGQGPSGIDPAAEKAYTAFLGSIPTAILWQSFHGAYSSVMVTHTMGLKVWSQNLHIVIRGNWDRIFQHFSAAAQGRAWWFSADIKAEFNNLRISGGIEVELTIDGTTPQGDALREAANKRIDLIIDKFMQQAQKFIFEPAPPDVKPAEAGSGGLLSGLFGWGGGFALKYRRDEQRLNLKYEETVNERYLMQHVISSSLEGFYNEIKADPANEQKYFSTLYLDDWERKVTRIVKPIANWPNAAQRWVGDPVEYLGVQVGYPATNGTIQWAGQVFQNGGANNTTTWQPAMAMKRAEDVVNAPAGWTPDKTFIKRSVHLQEPPGETDNPFMRVLVERNVIELDPEPNGTLSNDINVEVRADSAGKLELGPLSLNVDLESAKQIVELEVKALGKTLDGNERPVVRFTYRYEDQTEARYFEIFTGDPTFLPQYQYRVHVVVKGTIFSKGMEWWGPWVDGAGNGPIMISVPTPDEAVSTRRLTPREITSPGIPRNEPEVTTPTTPTPTTPTPAMPGQPPIGGVVTTPPAGPQERAIGAPPSERMVNGAGNGSGVVSTNGKQSAGKQVNGHGPSAGQPEVDGEQSDKLTLVNGWSLRD
ncbi:MAG: hypothetical protein R3C14_53165 [Caldilineaceae bacterium]